MAALCNFSREMQDSIREALDRRVKLFIRRMVRQELRSDKVENRILAFSVCRMFVLAARVPSKVEHSFHYLNIQSIESKMANQLILTVDGKSYTFNTLETDTDEVNHMITHIGTSVKQIYASFPLDRIIKKIEVQPSDRLKTMHEMIREIEAKPIGPCGGYTVMYACMCDYHGLSYREEIAWDVDTIYLSQDSREFCLQHFDHLNGRDLAPVISALEHNPWFTKLNANNVKLIPETAVEILRVMKRNAVLEELCLSGTGINSDFIQKLATAILSNSGSQLSRIDLSCNPIEDRGAIHFVGATSSLVRGIVHLDMSRTKLSGKGLNKLLDTLSQSELVSSTLTSLNLSDIPSKGEDLQNLYNFLAKPNAITHLNLSGTDCALDRLFGAMLRGSCSCITSLKLSRNTFTHKKMKDVLVQPSWKMFFSSVVVLENLDLSNNKLPPEALKDLLLGISSNRQINNLHLDISSNDLQTQGAQNLENCIADMKQVTSLDISNNGFDQDISSLAGWITQNTAIKHLAIGRNFGGIKPKHLSNVLDSIVQIIQDEDSVIESLSLADSKLKGSLAVVVNALGSNMSLREIDLSGNNMGDFGARMLSKALQINSHLKTIFLDKNGLTAQGFEDIADALEKNYVLKKIPTPVNDAAAVLRTQQERTERALQRIEALLQRNHSPQKFASDQAYRLQQGFLISSTQQMVDRLVVQVQDNMNALSMGSIEGFQSDIQSAQDIIKDADNSKQLLPRLQDIAMMSMDAGNPVDARLQEMSEELKQVLERHMKITVTDMIDCTKKQCAAIMAEKVFVSDLEKGCVEKSTLPKDFTKHCLDGIETDMFNKVSELNLAVAAHISDRAIDEVITSLSRSHKTLMNHLNKKKQERGQVPSLRIRSSIGGESPKLTSKKKSLYGRKLRPQSTVVDVIDIDLPQLSTKTANDWIVEAESIESLDDVAELGQVQKLNHIVKDRPKRARAHAPRRPMTRNTSICEDNLEPDDGLDKFFSQTPVTEHAQVLPNKNRDRDNDKTDTSSSGTESARSTPESKKKTGWLKSLGGKDKEKKQTSGLFSRNKSSKSSDDKINRISEVDENKSDIGVTNGPVDTVTKDSLQQESPEKAPVPAQTPTTTPSMTTEAMPSEIPPEQKKIEMATLSQTLSDTQVSAPTGDPTSPASTAPDSEQKPVNDAPEESDVKETENIKEEEKSETPRRQPAGIPKIGLGGNVLAEMKAKQEKLLTIQESKAKVEKMPNIPVSKLSSHKQDKEETTPIISKLGSHKEDEEETTPIISKLGSHKEDKEETTPIISKLGSHKEDEEETTPIISKLSSHKEETTAAELGDSKKSLSNQNSQSSTSSVEELKTEQNKQPVTPANGDMKSSSELNNNVKVKPSAGRQALLPLSHKRDKKVIPDTSTSEQNTADLLIKLKARPKPPPPMKPRPPPVAPKPGRKSGDADDFSSEDNSEVTEQKDSAIQLSKETGDASVIPVLENVKENKNTSVEDSPIAPIRAKKQVGGVQSVRDRIKSMELGKQDEPNKDDTKKTFSLPKGITSDDNAKTKRPTSMALPPSDLKGQLKTPLNSSMPALNRIEDKTINGNLIADLDDTKLELQKEKLEHELKNEDEMKNGDNVAPVAEEDDDIIMV